MPTGSVVQSSTAPTASTASSSVFTLGPESLLHPAAQSIEPGAPPSAEHERLFSQTPHPDVIMDTAVPARRRCHDCGVESTKQWRTRPEILGSLCNACGQHRSTHGAPRSFQLIKRAWAEANHEDTGAIWTRPNRPPEKRGGDVIMRVPIQKPSNMW
ncbi:hypothetical protein C8R45DRAFT_183788 [Mycena sanguinolenta]|nr:hypothetical protein C8R45DRAFT_183788 [Mycena sanguinolenta]